MIERIFNTLAIVAITLSLYVYGQSFGGKIEGRYFPVVIGVDVNRVEAVGDTKARIWGEFQKVRECAFVGLAFYLGTPGNAARVDLDLEEASKQRAAGFEDFGPWLVQLDPEQLRGRAFAVVQHRCHPFWITETVFYPQ